MLIICVYRCNNIMCSQITVTQIMLVVIIPIIQRNAFMLGLIVGSDMLLFRHSTQINTTYYIITVGSNIQS